jgi:hypothetical protein
LAIASSATRLRLVVVIKWIGNASKNPPSGAPIPIWMTVLPGPFSSPPAANSSGLARSSCRASSRAKANFTGRSTSAESLSEAPASAASRRRPSGVTMAIAPLSSRYVAAHSSNRRQRLGIFALATLPVSASINAQTLSPDKLRAFKGLSEHRFDGVSAELSDSTDPGHR